MKTLSVRAFQLAWGRLQILVQNRLKTERHPVVGELRAKETGAAVADLHVVEIVMHLALERGRIEALLEHESVVGIDDERVVDRLNFAQRLHHVRAIVGEVAPGLLDYRAGNIVLAQPATYDFLGAVRRARVLDQDIVDERANAIEATRDNVGLVFDDHAQTDGLHNDPLRKRNLGDSSIFPQQAPVKTLHGERRRRRFPLRRSIIAAWACRKRQGLPSRRGGATFICAIRFPRPGAQTRSTTPPCDRPREGKGSRQRRQSCLPCAKI